MGRILLVWNVESPLSDNLDGQPIEIGVHTQDEEQVAPCSEQLAAWRSFIENRIDLEQRTLDATFKYYESVRPSYARMGPEIAARLPVVVNSNDIASMIQLSSVTIRWPYDNADVRITAIFGCTWDQEHGLGIVYQNNQIVNIGPADCAI